MAATYQRVVDEAEAASSDREDQIDAARRVFYEGFVAETIAEYVARAEVMDSSGEPHHGIPEYTDMAHWRASSEKPATYDYHGYSVCKPGPWSQGPVLLQQMALLQDFDMASMDSVGPEFVHTVTECAKLAFADREAFYGDPDFVEVPLSDLLDPAFAAERRTLVGAHASGELRPGSPGGHVPQLPPRTAAAASEAAAFGLGEPTIGPSGETRGDTCHVDVADRFGNLVSATPSGGWLHSSPVIPGLGSAWAPAGRCSG